MPAPTKGPRLGGGPAHERLILANLVTALFEHDSITTTEAKAKRMRPLAERMVTFAKRGDLHARRRVIATLKDKGVVHRLFVEIAPDMAERPGGYTRITKIAARKGDNAPMAVIELVREPVSAKPKKAVVAEAEGATKRSAKDKAKADKAAAPVAEAPLADAPVAEIEDAAGAAADDAAVLASASADDVRSAGAADVQDAATADVQDAPVADEIAAVEVTETDAAAAGAAAEAADLTSAEPVAATKAAGLSGAADAPAVDAAAPAAADVAAAAAAPAAAELPAGAAAPNADGSAPAGYTVKGNADSGLYHEPDGQWYDATEAEFWFKSAADAEAAGFRKAGSRKAAAEPVAFVEAEYGKGSAEPTADGSAPAGHDVKGNKDSMLFHVPGSQWYDATEAEVWFDSAETAEKAGFKPAGGAAKQQVDEA